MVIYAKVVMYTCPRAHRCENCLAFCQLGRDSVVRGYQGRDPSLVGDTLPPPASLVVLRLVLSGDVKPDA